VASLPSWAPAPVDFALLTVLEEERDALLSHLPGARALSKEEGDVATAYAAELPTARADEAVYRVVFASLGAMGPVAAAARAAAIAHRFQPRRVLLVGIVGGVSGEAELGDVLEVRRREDQHLARAVAPEHGVAVARLYDL
jgi:nucleoside phosphorylase